MFSIAKKFLENPLLKYCEDYKQDRKKYIGKLYFVTIIVLTYCEKKIF